MGAFNVRAGIIGVFEEMTRMFFVVCPLHVNIIYESKQRDGKMSDPIYQLLVSFWQSTHQPFCAYMILVRVATVKTNNYKM